MVSRPRRRYRRVDIRRTPVWLAGHCDLQQRKACRFGKIGADRLTGHRQRVMCLHQLAQPFRQDMRIDLRCRDIGVAQ